MTQNKKIAVTGGIGSGKSAVMEILRGKGYPVFSCDEIYAALCLETEFLDLLEGHFAGAVKDGKLDRRALSQQVFIDKDALATLNALTHPRIMERLLAQMNKFPLSFAEVPLLFESGYEALFDRTIVVLREVNARIKAVKARDRLPEEEIRLRIARQFDYRDLPEGCFVLQNDGPLAKLEEKLDEILKMI